MPKLNFTETTADDGDGQSWSIKIKSGQTVVGTATLRIRPDNVHLDVKISPAVLQEGILPPITSGIGLME